MMSRADLIEYLCAQQHAAYEEAALLEGVAGHPAKWGNMSAAYKSTHRASMQTVLQELEDLGMLVSARVPA